MNDVVTYQQQQGGALAVSELRQQVDLIQAAMKEVMRPDEHYGYIPGTGEKKPSLLKAGAEKLCLLFRLAPDYEIVEKEREGDHLTITSKCTLTHIPTSQHIGSALGSCSTMESKYAYRHGSRACPECGAEAIIKGKEEYGGGFLCFAKKGGCGAKFADGDARIEMQAVGRVANEDKADQYNTVLKMSNKRALLAAVLNATAASDIFTQDVLDESDIKNRDRDGQKPGGKRNVRQPAAKKPAGASAAQPESSPAPAGAGHSSSAAINATQVKLLRRKCEDKAGPDTEAAVCEALGVTKLEEIPAAEINRALEIAEQA